MDRNSVQGRPTHYFQPTHENIKQSTCIVTTAEPG